MSNVRTENKEEKKKGKAAAARIGADEEQQ